MSAKLIRNVMLESGEVGAVVINGSIISAIGPGPAGVTADAETIDAGERLLLPAFVDAHAHMDKSLLGREWYVNDVGPALPDMIDNERRYRVQHDVDFREQTTNVGRPARWLVIKAGRIVAREGECLL